MKLLRYGPKGAEKPGLLDAEGRIRDLSGVVADITIDDSQQEADEWWVELSALTIEDW